MNSRSFTRECSFFYNRINSASYTCSRIITILRNCETLFLGTGIFSASLQIRSTLITQHSTDSIITAANTHLQRTAQASLHSQLSYSGRSTEISPDCICPWPSDVSHHPADSTAVREGPVSIGQSRGHVPRVLLSSASISCADFGTKL